MNLSFVVAACAACLVAVNRLDAQVSCSPDGNGTPPYLTVSNPPAASWPLGAGYPSRAWYSDRFAPLIRQGGSPNRLYYRPTQAGQYPASGGTNEGRFGGFPLNLSLGVGPTPPDFAGLGTDASSAPSPLVPASAARFGLPTAPEERATLGGEVDLITGSPLIAHADLSLPFGGAVFRHVRTYSEPSSELWHEQEAMEVPATDSIHDRGAFLADELFSDWHGQGWMMGESPVFLFDAAYETLTARPADEAAPADTTRVCYFIPDAHHSIPFVRVVEAGEARPRYVALPHIDAMMTVDDGTFNESTGEWTSFPTTVSVWLHGRTVRYRVRIQQNADGSLADVPAADDGVSLHASPALSSGRGTGTPGWGRVDLIEDRYGNRVELEYGDDRYRTAGQVGGSGCHYVHQNSNERGQLKAARLYAAGPAEDPPVWTVFYLHRSFRSVTRWGSPDTTPSPFPPEDIDEEPFFSVYPYVFPYHRQNAVIAVYAYRGYKETPAVSLTLDTKYFEALRDGPPNGASFPLEPGDPPMPAGPTGDDMTAYYRRSEQFAEFARQKFGLHDDWAQRSTYVYSDPTPMTLRVAHTEQWEGNGDAPRLLIARSEARDAQLSKDTAERVYRYTGPKIHSEHWLLDTLFLTQVYSGTELAAAIRSAKAAAAIPDPLPNGLELALRDAEADAATIATARLTAPCFSVDSAGNAITGPGTLTTPLHRMATRSFLREDLVDIDPLASMPIRPHRVQSAVVDFLGSVAGNAAVVTYGGVEYFTARSSSEAVIRSYRLQRLLVHPGVASLPMPTEFYENFRLIPEGPSQGYFPEKRPQVGRSVLHYPYRFILRPGDVNDPSAWLPAQGADQPTFIAVITGGETPNAASTVAPRSTDEVTRHIRVVQMNAAGVVIRDTLVPSDGESQPIEQIPTLDGSVVRDARGSVIEQRSAGYHSPENLTPASAGLIEVSVYDYAGYVYSSAQSAWLKKTGGDIPSRLSMLSKPDMPVYTQLVARGFKFGDQSSTWYLTHYYDYHANNPELVTKEVELATPMAMTVAPTAAAVQGVMNAITSFAAADAVRTHAYEFYSATQAAAAGTPLAGSPTVTSLLGHPAPATVTLPFADFARVKRHVTVHARVTDKTGLDHQLVEIERFDGSGRPSVVGRGYRQVSTGAMSLVFNAQLRLTD
ncbi:MAG TPA: hypothetical protein VEB22_07165, partial [Phycisphaerales bacterium]|nr:hypothetical protein [Phycisphaerales bacterium]